MTKDRQNLLGDYTGTQLKGTLTFLELFEVYDSKHQDSEYY